MSPINTDLPFVRQRDEKGGFLGSPRCFWCVESTGNWDTDCDAGVELARLYLDDARTSGGGLPLAWIVADMIAAGRYTGVEAGFMGAIARAALERPRR
jgi:hypothetical protein